MKTMITLFFVSSCLIHRELRPSLSLLDGQRTHNLVGPSLIDVLENVGLSLRILLIL